MKDGVHIAAAAAAAAGSARPIDGLSPPGGPSRDAAGHDAFHPPEGLKKLNWYQMAFICFVVTAAGPFGSEPAVRAGGPLLAAVVTFAVPILHVMPITLLVTELSSWMPTPHGSVLWISRAFGDTIGFMSSIMQLLINFVDIAIYPVLIGDYVSQQFPVFQSFWPKYMMQVLVVLLGGIPPLLSTNDFSFVSGSLTILILLPFVIGIVVGLPTVNPSDLIQVADNVDAPSLVSTGIWMYTGYLALGSLGAEVEHHSVFAKGCCACAFFSAFLYFLPMVVSTQINGDWSDGFLLTAMDGILPGLGYGVMAAGICSGFGLFTSSITCFSRTCWGIADKGWFPHVFTKTSQRTGSPYMAVLLHTAMSVFLVLFDFDFLVQFELAIAAVNFVLFYTAFIVLRYQEPEREKRPFVVPGGMPAAWALIAPIVTVYFGLFLSLCVKDWRIDVGVLACCAILFSVYHWVLLPNQRKHRRLAAAAAAGIRGREEMIAISSASCGDVPQVTSHSELLPHLHPSVASSTVPEGEDPISDTDPPMDEALSLVLSNKYNREDVRLAAAIAEHLPVSAVDHMISGCSLLRGA